MNDRSDLRTQMKMLLKSIPGDDRRAATKALADVGEDFLTSGGRKVVAGFYPMDDGITPLLLMQALFRSQIQMVLPKCGAGGEMRFHRWWPGDRLMNGPGGQPEPLDETDELVPELLLVPLLGFDAVGNRLGTGEDGYARAISMQRTQGPVTVIGIGFAEQELAQPLENDAGGRLDWIITPNGVRALTH